MKIAFITIIYFSKEIIYLKLLQNLNRKYF